MIKELQILLKECNKEVTKCIKNKQTEGQMNRNINRLFNNYWIEKAKQKTQIKINRSLKIK